MHNMDIKDLISEFNEEALICDGFDENETLVGIVTERDILRTVAQRRSFSEVDFEKEEPLVSEIMTRPVITGSPEDSLEETMELMTQQRIRHLPLQEKGKIVGLVSIGDIVKARTRICVRFAQARTGAIMSPSVGKAGHAGHHVEPDNHSP